MELTCVQCEKLFMHTARDQEFFQEKGWGDLKPKRCQECRKQKRATVKKAAVDKLQSNKRPKTSKSPHDKGKKPRQAGKHIGPIEEEMVKINRIFKDTKARVRVDTTTRMVTVEGSESAVVAAGVQAVHEAQEQELKARKDAEARRINREERDEFKKRQKRRETEAREESSTTTNTTTGKKRPRDEEAGSEDEGQVSQGASKPGKKVRPSAKQRRKAMAKSKPSTEEGQDGEATKEDEEGKKAAAQAFREAKKKKAARVNVNRAKDRAKDRDKKPVKGQGGKSSKRKAALGVVPVGATAVAKITSGLD